ncbi:DUF3775 domain-containing protein [Breoghania sp.]|uniref:DUF3775 domain-containing protein n=1 Tax=Breoghania sp. TaxID=2065378 RepID=UPI002AA89EAA|nr:DUF3775 domain-containing protein [Breoghania sp.]
MTRRSLQTEDDRPDLTIALEAACFIAIKARELDVTVEKYDPDDGSKPADDYQVALVEEEDENPALEEISAFIDMLSVDAQTDLVALMWLGRGDYTADDWEDVREEAANAHNNHTAEYLCGTTLLADYLGEGLALLNYSCADYEEQHL